MTTVEKEALKAKYKYLKDSYKKLKNALIKIPEDSKDYYELKGALSELGFEIAKIRKELIDDRFRRFYPTTIIENFFFEEKRKDKSR